MTKQEKEKTVSKMFLRQGSLALFADIFGISLAGLYEHGIKVLMYYKGGERFFASFNGGAPLQDEYPWRMTAPIARYLHQRGVTGTFGLKLIYTEKQEYKLQELLLD
jgi:hypothetical protein